jgi:diguanylate cyclase (GGDEF)-like protein
MDGLLGIPNRRRFDEYLQQEWRRARRYGTPLSVIMIDIDYFKLYNDHYGHQAGDDCLKKVADVLKRGLRRPADMVARYGGEEFVCVLPDTSLNGAEVVAKEVRRVLFEEAIPHVASQVAGQVTLSMGIAAVIPTDESSAEALLSQADGYLYLAKSGGRDRYVSKSN